MKYYQAKFSYSNIRQETFFSCCNSFMAMSCHSGNDVCCSASEAPVFITDCRTASAIIGAVFQISSPNTILHLHFQFLLVAAGMPPDSRRSIILLLRASSSLSKPGKNFLRPPVGQAKLLSIEALGEPMPISYDL